MSRGQHGENWAVGIISQHRCAIDFENEYVGREPAPIGVLFRTTQLEELGPEEDFQGAQLPVVPLESPPPIVHQRRIHE